MAETVWRVLEPVLEKANQERHEQAERAEKARPAASDANPFFSNAARHLLHGVLTALIASAPEIWTLRHVILILRDASLLERVLSATAFTRHLLQYFENEATFQNILSTVLTRLAPYEIIAAMWDRATVRLSLRQWLNSESILVLGNDEENRAAIDTIQENVSGTVKVQAYKGGLSVLGRTSPLSLFKDNLATRAELMALVYGPR